jgi:cation diffusion facilitator CzcD-associated flavoprotein CzcO
MNASLANGAPLDVLIVGAGLSGLGAACHLSRELPQKSYAIVEARDKLGGTWDLFRYPGVRSDSDAGSGACRGRGAGDADPAHPELHPAVPIGRCDRQRAAAGFT